MNRTFLNNIFVRLRLLVTAFVTLAIFNYPRTWWQEILCATSLVWCGFFFVLLCVDIVRARQISWTLARVVIVALQALCVARTGQIVTPYLYATQKSYPNLVYSNPVRFLFIDISDRSGNAHAAALQAFVRVEDPSMIILTRYADTPILAAVAERFTAHYVSRSSHERVVEVLSKLQPLEPPRLDYGYAALPAVAGEFQTVEGTPFVVGAFDLLSPFKQEDFLRSRLTSRRLASFLKYMSKPRMVFGAFRTSRTSQVVDMYSDQLRLRELSFDSGISILPELVRGAFDFERGKRVFTARNVVVSRIVQSNADGAGFSGVSFDARIPLELAR